MIVIADSGLTKTDWRIVVSNDKIISFETKGLSPFFCNDEDYFSALTESFPKDVDSLSIKKVFFYGSGCAGEEKGRKAQSALQLFFEHAQVYAYSDLLAAARSLFGDGKGVVAILGTGSNIAYFDGEKVIHKTPSLGFVLGDEGSGASIGRQLVQDYFYGNMPVELAKSFESEYNLDLSEVLDKVYSQPKPSAYLASFVPFAKTNIENAFIKNLLYNVFDSLYNKHLRVIPELNTFGLGCVGSVGFVFKDILNLIADERGFKIVNITRYPIDNLIKYHMQKDF